MRAFTVGSSQATKLADFNPARLFLTIQPVDGDIYIKFDGSLEALTSENGQLVESGTMFSIVNRPGKTFDQEVWAIAADTDVDVRVQGKHVVDDVRGNAMWYSEDLTQGASLPAGHDYENSDSLLWEAAQVTTPDTETILESSGSSPHLVRQIQDLDTGSGVDPHPLDTGRYFVLEFEAGRAAGERNIQALISSLPAATSPRVLTVKIDLGTGAVLETTHQEGAKIVSVSTKELSNGRYLVRIAGRLTEESVETVQIQFNMLDGLEQSYQGDGTSAISLTKIGLRPMEWEDFYVQSEENFVLPE